MAFTQIDPTKLAQWIKENPGKKYKINGVEQVAPESGLSKLLSTLTRPLRAVPASLYGAFTG